MSIGRKGMLVAAKTLALTAIRIYETPGLADAARRDFDKRRGTVRYNSRIPADAKPPLDYRRR
jgi:aminobenzoyl-glutamate utilization protein B